MRTCPFCAEQIQDDAIKCRYCREWLPQNEVAISDSDSTSSTDGTLTDADESDSFPHEVDATPQTSIEATQVRNSLEPEAEPEPQKSELKGIGGWLALFVIGNLVLGPMWTLSELNGSHTATEIIQKVPAAAILLGAEKAVLVLIVLLGVVAAIFLLGDKDSRAILITKIYLSITPVIVGVLLILYSVVDLPNSMRSSVIVAGIAYLVKVSVYSLIWFLYVTKSRRVKSTYLQSQGKTLNSRWVFLAVGVTAVSVP